ncbi:MULTISPECIES: alpha-hydroxy-acid oxidizing protein [unclassified Novosphingobium]|uniref:alpha-hydroxy-acid oxidizing protein n=1 Tax=unclassified Novosphingobium TaxID=2644732 RepID=UPI001445B83D|nr:MULTISPECIES: alpha-hydroxy-acid oxidizing protein [unclassified Novosphingobium]NKJ45060.1 (S)-mandelate dehydrogenase [Novosphingobium sp. SG720]NMN07631.1 (S)-mandelate dehydrogenase [Novosphingobium sp. SG919]NMN89941.1 (S)-mandelate dehydrogenase [Novosphingobium sp. SG916]
MAPPLPLPTIDDYRREAKRRLPRMVYDYVEGGAGSERGLDRNRDAFAKYLLSPRRLVNVQQRRQSVAPLGSSWAAPFAVAPMGLNGVVRPGGDLALAKAAARMGIPFCLSTASTSTIEEVAAATSGEIWFQLYVVQRNLAEDLVRRAAAAGCTTLVLTVDVAVNGERIRDKRSGFGVPFRYTPRIMWDAATHPVWSLRQVFAGWPELAHFRVAGTGDVEAQAALMGRQMDASFDWEALAVLRDAWQGKLLVKGILAPGDASHCEKLGVDGLIISNHGARQIEDVMAPIDALPAIRRACQLPLLLDSGIRHGADVVKAIALGAAGALIGRPLLYGLAARGARGADDVFALLSQQIDNTLALIGCPDIAMLDETYIA